MYNICSQIFITIASTVTVKEEDFFVHNHSDDYEDYEYDDPKDILTNKPGLGMDIARTGYEVTEVVDDIPNPWLNKGPVVPNFTTKLPLNNATIKDNSNVHINRRESDKVQLNHFYNGDINKFLDRIPHVHRRKNLRKNIINIFHVNAEHDNDKDNKATVQDIHVNQRPNFGIFNLKDQVNRVKDVIVKKEAYNAGNRGAVDPDDDDNPLSFLSELQNKGSGVVSKLHDTFFGRLFG